MTCNTCGTCAYRATCANAKPPCYEPNYSWSPTWVCATTSDTTGTITTARASDATTLTKEN